MSSDTILILEPDLLARHPLAEYLRQCGYRVLEATTTAEARQFLSHPSYSVDIVFAAVDMPDENGFALAAWIHRTLPSVEVVLAGTVAHAAEKAGDLCEQGPALSKPYDHQLLLNEIRRLRASRRQPRDTPA